MGIGSEFNEDLLIPLADMTGGNAYYIETPEKIPEAFSRELGAALRISYLNVEIKLQLPAGVDLRNVYRVLPELSEFDPGPNMEGSYALLLGDFDPAAPVGLVAELVVAPRPPGSYRLAQALLSWEDPLAQAGSSFTPRGVVRKDVVLEVANLPSATKDAKPDGRVMSFVDKVGAFKMGTLALRDAQQAAGANDPEAKGAATIRLREAATRLLDMGEATLSEIMARQADFLQSSGNLDKDASKKFRYETRRITQH
jgi:Ca-activated chloride channel family protein